MDVTIDISDWESEDWDESIRSMEEWIRSNVGDPDLVWPNRQALLRFDDAQSAMGFFLRWY